MSATIEVKYFNSFWVKKVINSSDEPVWPGVPSNDPGGSYGNTPPYYPDFPCDADVVLSTDDWFIEESRIKGGYNNTSVSLGVRAYLNEVNPVQERRLSSLIYSGVYNSRTGINQTNVFPIGEAITRSLDPDFGSLQKTHAEDTNLILLQESKVSQALIDKDAIYSAEGNATPVTSINQVIGTVTPYLGRFGISTNPESFAYYGFRKYWIDQNRGTVCRLSRDGITEIANYGMKDYFRDSLGIINTNNQTESIGFTITTGSPLPTDTRVLEVSLSDTCVPLKGGRLVIEDASATAQANPTITNIVKTSSSPEEYEITLDQFISPTAYDGNIYISYRSQLLGAWDNHNKNYTVSTQSLPSWLDNSSEYNTLAFDEDVQGWTSFFNYKPSFMFSSRNNFYSTINDEVYLHYANFTSNTNFCNFYNTQHPSIVSFVINTNPSTSKNFQTISYEGDNGWYISDFTSDYNKYNPTIDNDGAALSSYTSEYRDSTNVVLSYETGKYTENGYIKRAGFDRKENKYVANLINNSPAQPGEIVFGGQMSGIKGFYATVSIKTDSTTDVGGAKELWTINSRFVKSS